MPPQDSPRALALPLHDETDLDPLLDRIGEARYVLLGEASHGTHEFYAWRAAITRRLIVERGFSFVAVEADWPDCARVSRAVTADPGAGEDPVRALAAFDRWPEWMWANREVAAFIRWLHGHNTVLPADRRAGFYGLDLYSLWDSLHGVVRYLREHEPEHVDTALEALRCLEPYAEDPQAYAQATWLVPTSCEQPVVTLLTELRRRVGGAASGGGGKRATDGAGVPSDRFDAEQNAFSVAGAEAYYRAMISGGPRSWNVRDTHMADTLDRLVDHHAGRSPEPVKAVVWEHNTHIGDARFTDMNQAGMVNVGQLVRERHDADGVVLVGFGSYEGTVVAADAWGDPPRVMTVPPARQGSVEHLLHGDLDVDRALLVVPPEPPEWLTRPLDHRAIGVVYRPDAERWGNYVATVLGRRYDAFLWFDRTRALTPLPGAHASGAEAETWPFGT